MIIFLFILTAIRIFVVFLRGAKITGGTLKCKGMSESAGSNKLIEIYIIEIIEEFVERYLVVLGGT